MKLLIIDDDRVSTVVSTWAAKNCGVFTEIESVQSGRDALKIFEQVCKGTVAAPDLVLLDLNMPVMNGFDFLEHLQGLTFPNKNDLSIAILTSSEDSRDILRARSLGIKHYLSKSLALKDLQSNLVSISRKTNKSSMYFENKLAINALAPTLN